MAAIILSDRALGDIAHAMEAVKNGTGYHCSSIVVLDYNVTDWPSLPELLFEAPPFIPHGLDHRNPEHMRWVSLLCKHWVVAFPVLRRALTVYSPRRLGSPRPTSPHALGKYTEEARAPPWKNAIQGTRGQRFSIVVFSV